MTTARFVTNRGEFTVRLTPEHAPVTVANFVELAKGEREWRDPRDGATKREPLYAGTIFHRVIPDFMIQGGDPAGTGRGGPGYDFDAEVPADGPSFRKPALLPMAPDVEAGWAEHLLAVLGRGLDALGGQLVQEPVGAHTRAEQPEVRRVRPEEPAQVVLVPEVVVAHHHHERPVVDARRHGRVL